MSAALTVLALVPAQLAVGVRSGPLPSRGSLKRQQTRVKNQIRVVRSKLKQTRIEQRNVMGQLSATQRRLEDTQQKVIRNKLDLMNAEENLRVITRRLDRTQRQLERRGKLLAGRLVQIYKGEDIGYLDVLLGSRDMRTFLSRGYYVKKIVQSDVKLIDEIKAMQEQVERDKKAQAAEVGRVSRLQADLIQQRDSIQDLAGQKQAELDAIEHNLELYERVLADLEAQSQAIAAAIQRYQSTPRGRKRYAQAFTGALGLPVSGRITSRFGYRVHPINGAHSLHTGVDIACPVGTPVHASAAGEVILAGWMGAYGNAVVIDHGGGVSTLYGHNSSLLVGVGDQVEKGQVIARSGSTGYSTGPHVHFERRKDGRPVNPL